MKKSIFVLLASFCIALFFAMNVSINLSKDQSKSGLALKNIEALAWGEDTSQLWFRQDEDCVYSYSGSANKSVSINVGGNIISGKFERQGKFTYRISDAQTHCTSGGHEQCSARYCPVAFLI